MMIRTTFIVILLAYNSYTAATSVDSTTTATHQRARPLKQKPKIQLEINEHNSIKSDLLTEFLSLKSQEHAEKISLMQVPEFQVLFKNINPFVMGKERGE